MRNTVQLIAHSILEIIVSKFWNCTLVRTANQTVSLINYLIFYIINAAKLELIVSFSNLIYYKGIPKVISVKPKTKHIAKEKV